MPAIDERIKTYSGEAKIENGELNRFQDDAILNSVQGSGLNRDLHYPHIATSDHKLAYTTAPDKVTITGGQVFSVGGIRFNTSDLSNLEQTIPDNFDGYIRVAVAADCGDVVDAGADPIVRKLTVTFSQTTGSESDPEGTGGGPSSPESARLFHVTKGTGGTAPTITAYANDGHGHVVPDLTAEDVSFDNTTASLPGSPDDVQAALEAVSGRGLKIGRKIYDTPGTFTFTQGVDCPADVFDIFVTVTGAGGGGAGTEGGNMSPGGGAGATAQKRITLSAGESVTVTVGAKGPGGATESNGSNGGLSSFGAYCTANGGTGATKGRYILGGPGGTAVGGDLNITGGQGTSTRYDCGGEGGGSFFADGGVGGASDNAQGQPGQYGSGGGGGRYVSSGTSGGDGGDGIVIVTWIEPA